MTRIVGWLFTIAAFVLASYCFYQAIHYAVEGPRWPVPVWLLLWLANCRTVATAWDDLA